MKTVVMTMALVLLSPTLLAQSGTITGHVYACLDTCDPVPGAEVELFAGETLMRVVVADNLGRFVFLGVPSGREYGLEASFTGFASWRMRTWYLFSGQTQKVAVPLDYTIRQCNLGRPTRSDSSVEPAGVYRFRTGERPGVD